jgi:hypothetical protein
MHVAAVFYFGITSRSHSDVGTAYWNLVIFCDDMDFTNPNDILLAAYYVFLLLHYFSVFRS